jgi:FKBP-type peptidyl-prolyl cis-trans isomerase 2
MVRCRVLPLPCPAGDSATILYKLFLLDESGNKDKHVYSQSTEQEAFTLRVGAGQVIPGFDEAALGMGIGSKRVAILPSSIAYVCGVQL